MKIAAVQLACTLGDVRANLNKIRDFCGRAKQEGVELIVFPEAADTGYSMLVIRQHAKPWTEGAVPALQGMAKEFALTIVSGVAEREGDVIYNSQVFIDPRGEIAGTYRKTHLFVLPPNDESTCYTPGDKFVTVPAAGFRFGLSICYDLRFPEVCRTSRPGAWRKRYAGFLCVAASARGAFGSAGRGARNRKPELPGPRKSCRGGCWSYLLRPVGHHRSVWGPDRVRFGRSGRNDRRRNLGRSR